MPARARGIPIESVQGINKVLHDMLNGFATPGSTWSLNHYNPSTHTAGWYLKAAFLDTLTSLLPSSKAEFLKLPPPVADTVVMEDVVADADTEEEDVAETTTSWTNEIKQAIRNGLAKIAVDYTGGGMLTPGQIKSIDAAELAKTWTITQKLIANKVLNNILCPLGVYNNRGTHNSQTNFTYDWNKTGVS